MKSFDEMLATEEGKAELNAIIYETPELNDESLQLTLLEGDACKALDAIVAFGSFDQFPEYSDEDKRAINADLKRFGSKSINYDKLHELIDMAANRLRFDAYKIWLKRKEGGDA